MTPSGGPADRAAEVIRRRAARVGGWTDITDRAVSRVRAVGVRTWPLDAVFPTDAGPDTLRVSDAVVRTAVVRELIAAGTEVVALELYTEGHRCLGARVTPGDVSSRRTASVAAGALTAILGTAFGACDVDVVAADRPST